MFKYQQLDQQLAEQIARGALVPGERLPSLRRYAERQGVSLNTASRIYEQLLARGLIESQPQRGYFVRPQSSLPQPAAPAAKAVLATEDKSDLLMRIQRSALRTDVVNLGAGVLASTLLPITALQRAFRRASRRHQLALAHYGDPAGEPVLREAIAKIMARRQTPAPKASELLITNGSLEAVSLTIQTLTRPGDVIALFTPCYNGLLMQIQQLGRQVLEIPCTAHGPDLEYLEKLLRTRAFACLVFSAIAYNPLGFCLPPAQKRALAELALRYRTPFIEDDTFGELAYRGEENTPVYAYPHGGYITYCSSFSKTLSPGLRLGWLASAQPIDEFIKRKMALNLSCNLVSQYGLADYLFSDDYSAHLSRLTHQLQQNLARTQESIARFFPPGTAVIPPRGSFFLWLQLPDQQDTMALYERAEREAIVTAPGALFSLAGLYPDYLRLSVSEPWSNTLESGLKRLGQLAGNGR